MATSNEIASAIRDYCLEMEDNNLTWKLLLCVDNTPTQVWECGDNLDPKSLFQNEVEGVLEDLIVDGANWSMEIYTEDELLQAWGPHAPSVINY